MSLLEMLEGLTEAQIRFVVIGGVAATAHGSTQITNDLDICYDDSADNVARLAALLASWDAYPREVEPGLPFIMDARTLRDVPTMTLTTTRGDIDVFDSVAGVGRYADALAAAETFEVPPVRFRALGLNALIAAKRATHRPRDVAQLLELEAIQALRTVGEASAEGAPRKAASESSRKAGRRARDKRRRRR